MIKEASVVPEKQNLVYHVISIKWFKRWLEYIKKPVKGEDSEPHPGIINTTADLKSIIDLEKVDRLALNPDFIPDLHLKQTAKEEVDYKIVDQAVWDLLVARYGFVYDLPRISVQVPTADNQIDYIVEINHRRFELRTSPNIKYYD